MRFRKRNNFQSGVFLFLLLFAAWVQVYGWNGDRGLEHSMTVFKSLFEKGELFRLYSLHADPVLKDDISTMIRNMKSDKRTSLQIAKRLGFRSSSDLRKADTDRIIKRMIRNMQNPPENPREIIENAYYIESYLTLSMLFAPYDGNLTIDKKIIRNNSAEIEFVCRDYAITAFYVYHNGRWYLTSKKHMMR